MEQTCPICKILVKPSERDPAYICDGCINLITDINGRKVEYFNTHLMGAGCTARYRDSKCEHYSTNKCFINNIECRAIEGYFGGIVVQPVENFDPYFQKEEATSPLPEEFKNA